jgi:CCR4-NOT transcriptional complex subunit CAF120
MYLVPLCVALLIEQMPSMVLSDGKKLENILSVSTAASNKYLFHFNSFNSLTQWTAGIRLAMYEHMTLQEAYTGALIAGKGKQLNNIRVILDRQRAKHEDWARVRFGAGTPWRRCWCVVSPPDEKEYAKLQKTQKKANIYNRSPFILKGDMKFYDTKKITKKTRPIATVTEAYSCYAIYPQSKPLIDQSTLVKIEGKITIDSNPPSVTEGFVFVMPETHPAVSGFEIMLRFLFPVFDAFALYGRPNKLVSDVLDTRGLMFAMPPDRRYGYLEMWDVVGLIHKQDSATWSEREWRKQLKELTSIRMTATPGDRSRTGSRRNTVGRASLPPSRSGTLRFEERGSIRSQPSTRQPSPTRLGELEMQGHRRVDSAPPTSFSTPRHQRSVSEQTNGYRKHQAETPSRLAQGRSVDDYDVPPPAPFDAVAVPQQNEVYDTSGPPSPDTRDLPEIQVAATEPQGGPVASPPSFAHGPGQRPPVQPYHPPPMMKPSAQMDPATLDQMVDATNQPLPAGIAIAGAAAAWKSQDSLSSRRSGDYARGENGNQMHFNANNLGYDQYLHSVNSSRSGQSGNRLPTIPASPYIEQPEFVESPTVYQPTAPTVPEHAILPQSQPILAEELAHRPRPSSSGSQIRRKAVPGRSSISSREQYDNVSTKSSSIGSLRNDVVDPEALDRLEYTQSTLNRYPSQSSSRYDDDAVSTSTPDYASTIEEEVVPRRLPQRREERPRSGVLKFVGDPNSTVKPEVVVGDTHYRPDAKTAAVSADIPLFDFGPTYSLAPDGKRPGTSGTMTQGLHDTGNGFSRSKENLALTPNEQKRLSYLSGSTSPLPATHMRTSSASPQLSDTRSVAWQPSMVSQGFQHERQKLDADEWVAQRAAAYQPQASPMYGHGRSRSHTPEPMIRAQSGDWSHLQRTPEAISRPPSRPLSRPLSRGAGNLLDQRPTALSAREQEHVARATGTPLIDITKNTRKKQEPSTTGLTAYIGQREKEKDKAKANRNTAAVQAEIDRRTMAAQQQQMIQQQQMMQMQQMQQQMVAQSVYGTPTVVGTPQGGYPPAFAYSTPNQMYQQPQGYFPQPSPVMPGGMPGSWVTPSPQPMQGPYFIQQPLQQQQAAPQAYGASFDQAQAAARHAHQQSQQGQRRG